MGKSEGKAQMYGVIKLQGEKNKTKEAVSRDTASSLVSQRKHFAIEYGQQGKR